METEREGRKKRHTPTVLKRGKENKNKNLRRKRVRDRRSLSIS
jgi:hypothetical protein